MGYRPCRFAWWTWAKDRGHLQKGVGPTVCRSWTYSAHWNSEKGSESLSRKYMVYNHKLWRAKICSESPWSELWQPVDAAFHRLHNIMFRLDLVISFVRFSFVMISKYHVHNTFYICSVDLDIVHPIPTAGVGTPRQKAFRCQRMPLRPWVRWFWPYLWRLGWVNRQAFEVLLVIWHHWWMFTVQWLKLTLWYFFAYIETHQV